MAPSRSGAKREARNIAVGPSAPPIIPIEAASASEKLKRSVYCERASAPISVAKIPSCAAPPSIAVFGFAISGPKSVIAPTPIKIISGNRPL